MFKTDTTKYFLYARKSTDTEDRQITSIEDQISELRKVAFSRGIEIVRIFKESQSAKKPGRPLFNEMLGLLHKKKAEGILCWKLNRLARNPIDGGQIQWMTQERIIKSILTPSRDYNKIDDIMIMNFELGMANQFILDLARDVKRGMVAKAERGWRPGKAPLGYINIADKTNSEKNIMVQDKKEAMLIKQLFNLVLTKHATLDELQAEAEELGLTGKHKKVLQTSTIYRIITNPFYYGKYEWPKNSGNWYKGKHKPIITFTEYDQVQEIMAKRAKPKKDKFKESKAIEILEKRNKQNKEKENLNLPVIYQGLMTCKACGGAITASKVRKQQKNGNKHEYVYYHCSKRKDKKCPQKSYPLNQKDLEPQILGFLKDITIVPEVYNWAMQEAKIKKTKNYDLKEKILKTHKQNLVRAKNKIQNLIDMLADKDISRKEYAERRKKCEIEEAKAEEAITKIEDKERKRKEDIKKTYELMTNLKNKFKKGTPERKKEIIIKLGSNLSLENKKLVIMPDLKVQAFQKHAKGANFEIARFKPLEMPINKAKNTHREGAFSTWSE